MGLPVPRVVGALLVLPRRPLRHARLVATGGYIYGVYAFYCGNPWLLGLWDHAGHAVWPLWLQLLRDAAVVFCFVSALWIVGTAVSDARRARQIG